MKLTTIYQQTETLNDIHQSRISVDSDITPEGSVSVEFSTTFTQARDPAPRVQHTLFTNKTGLGHIIDTLTAAYRRMKE